MSSTGTSNTPPLAGERPELADQLLHFLASLGQRSEAELYLRLYRGLPRGKFALLVASRGVLEEHARTLAEQLAFLRQLGLSPSLLVGAVEPVDERLLKLLLDALRDGGLTPRVEEAAAFSVSLSSDQSEGEGQSNILVLRSHEPSDTIVRRVTERLKPRKLVFLRRGGGLGPHGGEPVVLSDGHFLSTSVGGITVVSLRRDATELLPLLTPQDRVWLERCRAVFGDRPPWSARATISIASPLSLLRELFTVRGEGTLVKPGAVIHRLRNYEEADRDGLGHLLEEAFGRTVKPSFYRRVPHSIYVEKDYRGVALLEEGVGAAFLSKFAVLPVARGEGLGQELWWEMSKDVPAVYLRARPGNPITAWYAAVCDGMHRAGQWNVYWKGVDRSMLPQLIDDALARQEDFEALSL